MELKFDENNFRIHTEKNKNVIRKSLVECGAGRSVLVDKDNCLIAGNGVYEQAKEIGIPIKLVETNGDELIVVKRNDISQGDERRKKLAFADNHASDTSLFDTDLLMESFSNEELEEWAFDVADIDIKEELEEDKNSIYTKKIVSPVYVPTQEHAPEIRSLFNRERYDSLMKRISNAYIDEEIAVFLALAATRHISFDYGKIAEFYAHQPKEIQELMEESALVIIDFNKAIEEGYVNLKEEITKAYMEDHGNDEE